MTPLQKLLSKLPGAKRSGKGWTDRCPAHDDGRASLSIAEGDDGRALVHCHAGCSTDAICGAVKLRPADLFPDPSTLPTVYGNGRKPERRRNTVDNRSSKPTGPTFTTADAAVAELERQHGLRSSLWTYYDAEGNPCGVVVRWDHPKGKDIRPVALIDGRWHLCGMPQPRPLYHLPEVVEAATVYVCEGEKAADAVQALGLTSTTSAHGSQSASQSDWTPLAGKSVVILPDSDEPGRRYAEAVAAILGKLTPRPTVKIVELPGLPDKGDAVEWIAAHEGQTPEVIRAELERLANEAESVQQNRNLMKPCIVRLCDVKPEAVRWLWPGRVALGKLTIIAGDPGLGKSYLSCDLSARISTGREWPDDVLSSAPMGGVVILNCEDDLADTIRPRLDAHGADVSKIIALPGVHDPLNDCERPFDLSRDLPALEQAILAIENCRLVVIDPITAYLGARTDSHNASDVRALLAPLSMLAAKHGVAVVGVSHLNKGTGAAMYRTMGSLAFVAAARAVWCVTKDKENPLRRLFLPVKNNLGNDLTGLAYSIVNEVLTWESAPVNVSADDALTRDGDESPAGELAEAIAWLENELTPGVSVPSRTILDDAKEHGIAEKRLRKAAKRIGVVIYKRGFKNGWTWTLPEATEGARLQELKSSASSQEARESSDCAIEDARVVKTGVLAEESGEWGEI